MSMGAAGLRGAAFASALACIAVVPVHAGQLEPALAALAQSTPRHTSAVLIELEGAPPLERYAVQLSPLPRAARPGRLAALMKQDFDAAAAPVLAELEAAQAFNVQPLWISHGIAAQVTRGRLAQLAALPGVKRIDADLGLRSATPQRAALPVGRAVRRGPYAEFAEPKLPPADAGLPASMQAFVELRALSLPPHFQALDVLHAWQRGHAGQGATVAVVDSGVDLRAGAVARAWRGPGGWFDPYGQQPFPTDGTGHGTQVASLIVGTQIDDAPVGVAPLARWIAARLFDDSGQGRLSSVQRIYQWLLDPDGDPATADAPDVVNNAWGLPQTVGRCNMSFARAFAALRAADIHVVFSAGNDGPAAGTSMSPANNPGVLSVGALTPERAVAARSSRGPSGCGDGPFPTAHAPGVNLPALDQVAVVGGGAAIADGTSFASAAVSGALAILRGALPNAGVGEIEALLLRTSRRDANDPVLPGAAVLSPDVGAALAAANVPMASGSPDAPVLRWAPASEGAPIEITPSSLQAVLPWSMHASTIRPAAAAPAGAVERRGEGWVVKPEALQGAPLRFDVASKEGRRVVVEFDPQLASAQTQARRQTVRTTVNNPVTIELAEGAPAMSADALQWTTPLRGGRLRAVGKGRLQYTPPAGFVGVDQFTYAPRADAVDASSRTLVSVQVQPR